VSDFGADGAVVAHADDATTTAARTSDRTPEA
jgi:hypothetical protein